MSSLNCKLSEEERASLDIIVLFNISFSEMSVST